MRPLGLSATEVLCARACTWLLTGVYFRFFKKERVRRRAGGRAAERGASRMRRVLDGYERRCGPGCRAWRAGGATAAPPRLRAKGTAARGTRRSGGSQSSAPAVAGSAVCRGGAQAGAEPPGAACSAGSRVSGPAACRRGQALCHQRPLGQGNLLICDTRKGFIWGLIF